MNRVVELYDQGATYTEIARGAGISISAVARELRKARDRGELPKRTPAEPKTALINVLAREGLAKGTITKMLLCLPQSVQLWVMSNTPAGATVAEFAAAVLLDAYYDETGDEDAT